MTLPSLIAGKKSDDGLYCILQVIIKRIFQLNKPFWKNFVDSLLAQFIASMGDKVIISDKKDLWCIRNALLHKLKSVKKVEDQIGRSSF